MRRMPPTAWTPSLHSVAGATESRCCTATIFTNHRFFHTLQILDAECNKEEAVLENLPFCDSPFLTLCPFRAR